jgi:hypothetical protein
MSTSEIPGLEGLARQLNRRRLEVTIPGEACKMPRKFLILRAAALAQPNPRERAVRLER